LVRFVATSLLEADPGEEREGPVEPAPVADVPKGLTRRGEPLLGPVGIAPEEGDGGQVLHRPRLAASIPGPTVEIECFATILVGRIEIALEQQRPAPGAQRDAQITVLAQRSPAVDGVGKDLERPLVVALHLVDPSQDGSSARHDPRRRAGICEDGIEVGARFAQLTLFGKRRGAAKAQSPTNLVVGVWRQEGQTPVVEPVGAAPDLGVGRPPCRLLEHR